MLKSGYTKNSDGTRTECYRCTVCRETFPLDISSGERNYHEEHCFPKGYLEKAKNLVGKYFVLSKSFAFFSCALTYWFKVTEVTDDGIEVDVVGDGVTGPYVKFGDTISYDDMVHSREIDRESYEKFITERLNGWRLGLCPWLIPVKTEEEKYADRYIPKGRLKGTEHSDGSPIKRVDSDSDFDYLIRHLNRMKDSDEQTSISFSQYRNVYEADAGDGQEVLITHSPHGPFKMSITYNGRTKEIQFDSFAERTNGWMWLELGETDYQISYGCVLIKEIDGVKAEDLRAQYHVNGE